MATNRGLIKYDGTSFTSYNTSGGQLSSNNVNGLAFDTNRNLWMGNWNVLVKYDGKQFSSYPLPSNYSNDWICDIAPDGNDVWVATRFHGLLRFYDGTFEQTELEKNILTQNLMHEVSTVDEKGNVCFASNDYLAQYTEKGEWKHLFPNAKDYYPAINAAAYDKRGHMIWLSYEALGEDVRITFNFYGTLSCVEFLTRLYSLKDMPSKIRPILIMKKKEKVIIIKKV